ncbi:UNVERIFIED_CONTAM: UDP-glucose 4-epimerase GalE [Streptococcus canis]|uniref:UDP-glucose 4-epimerase n=1 Tax=Streptococcus canis FSL Z3-227 TaxID=482234 RepID=A0AAV3FRQ8_STRCB|nr:UDP-glucose 4-epimerase GalE [Streptococcus canis]EIQ81715.1 UDP-glucose 4-epimerase [Streptococcus canis FSL Z3-227]MDV5987896.1 UDP-glucose 4-epimerase GalE [Streptococcus canis]MDV6000836.1 UDP-glucose 4-epimerase GalE [Streptococcus canis]MDV6021702.1 UDP-glucose 4-epimerase GalE [Streptococcus canis]VEE25639.1 UDP-glucose 4-epimerase [Streptococcus canis]
MSTILVTGGAGYIGSHTCVELLEKGHDLVVVDNLENANPKSLKVVEELTGKPITFYQTDILDEAGLEAIFSKHEISAVIHFAGLKAVGESTQMPLKYFTTNISGTLTLLRVMAKHQCKNIIFSSSATVYGDPHKVPITEDFPLSVTNPYGRTKLMVEEILKDVYESDKSWNIVILRYFNPIGAHQSGELGEDPTGIPNNLVPYVTQVAVGRLERIGVFGDDYDTPDGTGVRDYIHVVDLAKGHVAALQKLVPNSGLSIYNLGTGNGYSVLDIVKTMSEVVGKAIPYQIQPRRAGDIAVCYADSNKAKEDLGWQAKYDIRRMCQDHWRWQSKHPNGFQD